MSFDLDAHEVKNLVVLEKSTSSSNPNWADSMVTFEALLDKAHSLVEANKSFNIETEVIRGTDDQPMIDVDAKFALFKATVTLNGRTFTGHGDSTSENIENKAIEKHFIRMAETRAIVRALRFATNDARCAVEETENSGVDPDGNM